MTITKDSSAPLIAVVGATGTQGGSVVKALSESAKPYRIRAFTRDATKPAAQALAELGAEVVQVNLIVENRDEVFKAFVGADYAFCVTNFWEHHSFDREVAEGKLQIDAAKAAGVKGVVWSGLASVSKLSGGKYTHVYSFDSKALVTEYGRQAGVPFVEVRCGPYASAFSRPPFAPMKKAEGVYTLAWPLKADSKINIVDTAEDYGLFVRHVLELETFPDGDEFLAYSEVITPSEIAEQWSKATGKTIQFTPIPAEVFKMGLEKSGKVPPPLVLSLSDLTSSWAEFSFPTKPIPEGLGRPLRTWAEYAKITDWSKVLV